MARVKRGVTAHARHKKLLGLAKGYRGRSKNCFRVAIEKVEKALRYAYRDRRNRKRDFRKLWIVRINAGARAHGLTYARLIGGLKLAGLNLNRKMLAELAALEPDTFKAVVEKAAEALKNAPAKPAKKAA
jgi:large subunit ribosomal protein L20